MKKKVEEAIDDLDYEELIRIKEDIENSNAIYMKSLVSKKISDIEQKERKICVTCGQEINPYYFDEFRLEFGPRDLRKGASFCALDCLEYFLDRLKNTEKGKVLK